MERSRKTNRISWAPDVNLCQVRLFLSDDSPLKAGQNVQNNLQAKALWTSQSDALESGDLPPGFECSYFVNRFKEELHIPQIRWKCPPNIGMDPTWHVAAGEESIEADAQKLREWRVLEAVYPRLTDIPSCPSVSLDIEAEQYDDSLPPLVPITAIEEEEEEEEEEEGVLDRESAFAIPSDTPNNLQPAAVPQGLLPSGNLTSSPYNTPVLAPANARPAVGMLPGVNPDITAAASAALAAILKSNEKGSLIDTELLINILSNPKTIQQLTNGSGSLANSERATTNMVTKPVSGLNQATQSDPFVTRNPDPNLSSRPANGNSNHMPTFIPSPPIVSLPQLPHSPASSSMQMSTVSSSIQQTNAVSPPKLVYENLFRAPHWAQTPFNAISSQHKTAPIPSPPRMKASQPAKDINYYKNLIREHGAEKQPGIMSQYGNHNNHYQNFNLAHFNVKDTKPKTKRCTYFNSKRGCRDGSKCHFWHEATNQDIDKLETHKAKRVKLGYQ